MFETIQSFVENLVQNLQPFLEANGYWLISLVVFLENAGIPLPGETMLILASAFASQGKLNFAGVLAAAITGAVLGDNMGYFLGRKFGRGLILRYGKIFGLTPPKFEKAEVNFLKNSSWAVFFGRFIILLRILAGPLAGIANMPWPRFFLFNALGAICWATAIGTASFFFGKQVEAFFQGLGVWALVITVVLVILFSITREWWEERKLQRELAQDRAKSKDGPT
ncbi:DedA family protein [Anthocerotibacter panamensis]|uniref:DedA family protein n=1 Tax=Anthocerotibacter panamensis TaxID=2857077 RepID=UPI001C408250|nr:DedA family protein [Anthocerotibacter panamensis]